VPLSPEDRRKRARAAANTRHHPDRPELAEADRRKLKADAAERYIRALVDDFPSLTAEQRNRLALVLLGGHAA
jgi:hypothetical protein